MSTDVRLVMLGAPGAGKGTQAKRLAAALEAPHVSTGDMFRAEVEAKSDLGREADEYLRAGRLVPDELTVRLLERRLQESRSEGFVLDGFPRTEAQARALDALLERLGRPLDTVLLLEVPDEDLVDRLVSRRQCPACGAIYNVRFAPPREDEVCDNAGAHGPVRLVRREDDNEVTVRRRLAVYHEATEPVIAYYREAGLLETVPAGDAGPDEVYRRIQEILRQNGVDA
jgi:adenylate kinase